MVRILSRRDRPAAHTTQRLQRELARRAVPLPSAHSLVLFSCALVAHLRCTGRARAAFDLERTQSPH